MTQRTNPKACPFCGDPAQVVSHMKEYPAEGDHPAGEYEAWVSIQCERCGVEMGAEYRSEAVESWNARVELKLDADDIASGLLDKLDKLNAAEWRGGDTQRRAAIQVAIRDAIEAGSIKP